MSQYSAEFNGRVSLIVPPEQLSNTMGEYLSSLGKTQLRIAETEKYAHVTFFFNGGIERVFDGEDRILVPSPNVATYDLKPEMSAYEVTRRACECADSGKYDFMVLNFANTDMVGHTGVFEAAVKAVETVDVCVGTLVDHIIKNGGACLITADHGNCEQMLDEKVNRSPRTQPTPFRSSGFRMMQRAKNSVAAEDYAISRRRFSISCICPFRKK